MRYDNGRWVAAALAVFGLLMYSFLLSDSRFHARRETLHIYSHRILDFSWLVNSNFGYKVGIVSGAMYRYTKIENVIVKNSRISNNSSWTNISNGYRPSVFVGGIVGEAAYSATNSLTQVTERKICYKQLCI